MLYFGTEATIITADEDTVDRLSQVTQHGGILRNCYSSNGSGGLNPNDVELSEYGDYSKDDLAAWVQ